MADSDLIDTEIYTGIDVQEFTDFSADIDLKAAGPTGKGARLLWVLDAGSGVLSVSTKYGTRTLSGDILASKSIPLQCGVFAIRSATNVGRVLVIW